MNQLTGWWLGFNPQNIWSPREKTFRPPYCWLICTDMYGRVVRQEIWDMMSSTCFLDMHNVCVSTNFRYKTIMSYYNQLNLNDFLMLLIFVMTCRDYLFFVTSFLCWSQDDIVPVVRCLAILGPGSQGAGKWWDKACLFCCFLYLRLVDLPALNVV